MRILHFSDYNRAQCDLNKSTVHKSQMAPLFTLMSQLDSGDNHYRAYAANGHENWLSEVATEYVKLRTETAFPLEEIRAEGIQIIATDELLKRIQNATIPIRGEGNFDVIRSDFGEILCYLILERQYGTRFGYKSLRDRELTQLPGRGIDAIGVEDGSKLTLILGETKVSNEDSSPPQVVDGAKDSLRQQQLGHLKNRQKTAAKIWDISRRMIEPGLRRLFLQAALYLDEGRIEKLNVVACCVLVRPKVMHAVGDYGSFRASPGDYKPAWIRFLVLCIPDNVDKVVSEWHEAVKGMEVSK